MIITLCGSTRFKDKFEEIAREFTLQGHIVLMPHVFGHVEMEEPSVEQKIQLENLHREKINMSDAIFVIDVDKYIGESTFSEIDWASRMKKNVYFLEPLEDENAESEGAEPAATEETK